MREVVTLSITSFRGSIGGEHYYGKLHVETRHERITSPDGSTRLVRRGGYGVETHPHDGHELKRRLGAREAAYLNKKDDGGFFTSSMGLKAGDETTRFNDVDSIVAAAISAFPELFDDTDVLVFERERYSDEHEVLVAPDDVHAGLAGMKSRWAQEEWLMEHGYLLRDDAVDTAPAMPSDLQGTNHDE